MLWGIIVSILYIECGIVSLLVLPVVSLNQWQLLLHSQFVTTLTQTLRPWIYVYVCILTVCLLNSMRIMNQSLDAESYKDPQKLLQSQLQHALAQRNFYISAASVFLLALGRRLVSLKVSQAEEFEDLLNIGVEYKPGRRESQQQQQDVSDTISIPPLDINVLKEEPIEGTDWNTRIRRLTTNLLREEQNTENLKTCAKRLSNFCVRLDEDYHHLQGIIGTARDYDKRN